MNKTKTITRIIIYLIGLCVLALGLTLSTKADLGVSPIIAVSFGVSQLTGARFGDTTFVLYAAFVLIEIVLHILPGKRCPEDRKKAVLVDISQFFLSYVFTMILNVLSAWIPAAESIAARVAVLLVSIVLVGTGAAVTLDMRLIANPGDGLVQAISDRTGISLGLTKNLVDITCVTITCILTMAIAHHIIGVGIGTVAAMLGIGRVIALVNNTFGKALIRMAGMENSELEEINDEEK